MANGRSHHLQLSITNYLFQSWKPLLKQTTPINNVYHNPKPQLFLFTFTTYHPPPNISIYITDTISSTLNSSRTSENNIIGTRACPFFIPSATPCFIANKGPCVHKNLSEKYGNDAINHKPPAHTQTVLLTVKALSIVERIVGGSKE